MLRSDLPSQAAFARPSHSTAMQERHAKLGEITAEEFDEEIASLRKAVELNPQYYPAWQMLIPSKNRAL